MRPRALELRDREVVACSGPAGSSCCACPAARGHFPAGQAKPQGLKADSEGTLLPRPRSGLPTETQFLPLLITLPNWGRGQDKRLHRAHSSGPGSRGHLGEALLAGEP